MNIETAERIAKGNKAYYANTKHTMPLQSILCQYKTNEIKTPKEKH